MFFWLMRFLLSRLILQSLHTSFLNNLSLSTLNACLLYISQKYLPPVTGNANNSSCENVFHIINSTFSSATFTHLLALLSKSKWRKADLFFLKSSLNMPGGSCDLFPLLTTLPFESLFLHSLLLKFLHVRTHKQDNLEKEVRMKLGTLVI